MMFLLASLLPGFAFQGNDLPRILIIGDSIAGGYFPFVQEILKGKAILIKPEQLDEDGKPTSCEGTTMGVKNIDAWIGETKWDVIHFNFGLHDMKHVKPGTNRNSKDLNDPVQADLAQYEKNLRMITEKLKATGARLIFATTTPYPDVLDRQIRTSGMPEKYNEVALEIMKESEIQINDLYLFVLPRMEELQRPNNVHFTETGSKALAELVSSVILNNLPAKNDPS